MGVAGSHERHNVTSLSGARECGQSPRASCRQVPEAAACPPAGRWKGFAGRDSETTAPPSRSYTAPEQGNKEEGGRGEGGGVPQPTEERRRAPNAPSVSGWWRPPRWTDDIFEQHRGQSSESRSASTPAGRGWASGRPRRLGAVGPPCRAGVSCSMGRP